MQGKAYRGIGMVRLLSGLFVTASLSGCLGTKPVVVKEPVIVDRMVHVAIDPALTVPCPVAEPRNRTGGEALRVARARKAALEDCNARMAAIRSVQGTEVAK